MLSELLLPISYGNQCHRMQSTAKQVTLAPTATHKTLKTQVFGSNSGMGVKKEK